MKPKLFLTKINHKHGGMMEHIWVDQAQIEMHLGGLEFSLNIVSSNSLAPLCRKVVLIFQGPNTMNKLFKSHVKNF